MMMNNIIKFNQDVPNDLLTFREVMDKYGYKYNFLYKYTCLKQELTAYDKSGSIAVSEKELIEFRSRRSKKWQRTRKYSE